MPHGQNQHPHYLILFKCVVASEVPPLPQPILALRASAPPEQPSDDGAQELARRALALIEGRWHT